MMTTMGMKASEVIEQDTEEQEDIADLFQFLLPFPLVQENKKLSGMSSISQFSLSYNQSIFSGWVKQPSPCCAASSVAGAWNAVHHYSRNHEKALQYQDILSIYISLVKEKCEKKIEVFHRKLGYFCSAHEAMLDDGKVPPFDLSSERFWTEFDSRCLNQFSKQLGAKKDGVITKRVMEKVLQQLIRDYFLRDLPLQHKKTIKKKEEKGEAKDEEEPLNPLEWKDIEQDSSIPRSFLYCLTELYELENLSLLAPPAPAEEKSVALPEEKEEEDGRKEEKKKNNSNEKKSKKKMMMREEEGDESDEDQLEEEEEETDEEDEEIAVSISMPRASRSQQNSKKKAPILLLIDSSSLTEGNNTSSTNSNSIKSKKKWDWRKDLLEIIKAKSGLLKLLQPKPSTAYIGNWGILEAVDYLAAEHCYEARRLSARLFMGKKKLLKSKIDFPLSRRDSEETMQSQWEGLKTAFARPNQVLLFHLKNHYALVFALREWYQSEQGRYYRQVLTARKGQRPTAWLDFHELREVMLGWEGYKMILISATIDSVEAVQTSEALFQQPPLSTSRK